MFKQNKVQRWDTRQQIFIKAKALSKINCLKNSRNKLFLNLFQKTANLKAQTLANV